MEDKTNLEFKESFNYKVIYAFTIEDEKHKGLIKIGDATLHTHSSIDKLVPNCRELNQAALKRIKSYTNTAGVEPNLLYTELAIKEKHKKDGSIEIKAFRDHEVHRVLENSGIKKARMTGSTGKEWFKTDLYTAKEAIEAVKKYYDNLSNAKSSDFVPIVFRPEQKDAIEKTLKQFEKNNRMLWNAKMRFGKTLSALEVIRRSGFKKTIILTHRPVVNAGWYEDFSKIFHGTEYAYGSKENGNSVESLNEKGTNFVYFASIQDLRGSSIVGGKYNKNNDIFETVWDLVIVDEAHEGTKTALGDETIKAILKEDLEKTKLLSLSGTPFNILEEYDEKSIYTWDYIMEQQCKYEWDQEHFGDSNPYEELPELRIYTYDLGDLLHNKGYITYEDKAFNFHEFFRTWTGDYQIDNAQMPVEAKIGDFVHEKDVISLLNLMTKKDDKNNYPFSKEEYRDLFRHSLWMVPGVREAKALKNLMMKHPVFGNGQFDIINVAGSDDEESAYALNSVKTAISEAERLGTYTITLSCGKLTTGVTIKEWTAVFVLAGSYSTSASNYLQTIFRVQSPCNKNGKIKDTAYVFDFAPDRTLKMVSEAVSISTKAGKTKVGDKKILGKFLNYCPVISISGSEMKEYKTDRLLQELKKVYADKVVRNGFDDNRLYNDELLKLDQLDIEKFDHLKGIIGTSKAAPRQNEIKLNDQGLTDEEYEKLEQLKNKKKHRQPLTEEEKAFLEEKKRKNKLKNDAISILRGISIRMPLLIYGADVPYDEDITLDQFVENVDDSSWNEFMPAGVTKEEFSKFKKYYDEDIFIASGKKIRSIAKEADTLEPTERVKKIASLFSNFKNPDKETVLTPWRVVNMHMSSTLGGYDFWDEEHENEINKPRYVNQGKVTEETFDNTSAKILEINSKTGLYPLYVTHSIYRAKCNKYDKDDLTLELKKELWNDTLINNMYVICKTPMAKQITKRTLAGYSDVKINAHYFDDLINQLQNKQQQFLDHVLKASYWKKGENGKMKFDAVVGNPPYQEEGDSSRKAPVYHHFYNASFKLSKIVSIISPARFLFDAGQTPKTWNKKMLEDEHFRVVEYFSNSKTVFESVEIKGGIAITMRNENEIYGSINTFTEYPQMNSIIQKVKKCNDDSGYLSEIVASRGNYRFSDVFFEENPNEVLKLGKGTGNMIASNAVQILQNIFIDKPYDNEKYIRILARVDGQRVYRYILQKYILINEFLEYYNVVITEGNGTGAFGETLSTPLVIKPNEGATDTFISIGKFTNKYEAQSLLKYLKTKFARALLSVKKATQHTSKSVWIMVPMQNYTEQSDIDWNNNISDIDQQLYKKYNLTIEEIEFIENKVKPMD